MATTTKSTRGRKRRPGSVRLSPEARRKQLLEVAAAILSEHGVEKVEVKEVAARAGVTRPIVYRFFPTRQALVLALLEDVAEAIDANFRDALVRSIGQPVETISRTFVEASCAAIETKGRGPWHLLAARGADPEIAELGLRIHHRLFSPWYARIADVTDLSEADVSVVARIVVSSGRAALDGWLDGEISKERAVEHAARSVTAILRAYLVA